MISEGRSRRGWDWASTAFWLIIAAGIVGVWTGVALVGLWIWGAL